MIRVVEIFGPTIQGEGTLIGRPTVFVRTGGCDYRCSWCDSPHAVLSEYRALWTPMSEDEIVAEIVRCEGSADTLVTISGGNPALQDCTELVRAIKSTGRTVAVETQGSIAAEWLSEVDHLIVSPKPPSSGMETDWEKLAASVRQGIDVTLKVVVADLTDFAYAEEVYEKEGQYADAFVVQPCNLTYEPSSPFDMEGNLAKLRWLSQMVLDAGYMEWRVLPQMHSLMWGNKAGV